MVWPAITAPPDEPTVADKSPHKAAPIPAKEIEKVEVRVRVAVARLINVSLVDQTFTVEAQMEASWVDKHIIPAIEAARSTHSDGPLMAARDLTVKDLTVNSENKLQAAGVLQFVQLGEKEFFAPRLKFNNCIERPWSEEWFELFEEGRNTVVCMRWKFKGVFQENLELHKFPFDVQKLTMELRCSWENLRRSTDTVKYAVRLVKNQSSKYKSLINTRSFVQQSEYMLSDQLVFEENKSPPQESSSNKVHSARRTPSNNGARATAQPEDTQSAPIPVGGSRAPRPLVG